jgi:hypothetical protein
METNTCPVCGETGECSPNCPTQDPFHGDQAAENDDYEANARFDYANEAYGPSWFEGYDGENDALEIDDVPTNYPEAVDPEEVFEED